MRPRILLIGKNGQVGGELRRLLPHLGETVSLGRQELDLTDSLAVRRVLRELRPNLVVNAAAYTAVDQAESNPETASAINTDAPAVIAEEAKKLAAALVHYSTDYVFDGDKKRPYEEADSPNPINVYGRTKLAGEQAIQKVGLPHLIFRLEWVYATRGKNFLLTILRLATQREELRIVGDQVGAPTWSRTIALATIRILDQIYSQGLEISRLSGIYHLTATGQTTWCGFAQAILEECAAAKDPDPWLPLATAGKPLVCQRVLPIATSDYPTPARRPPYSLLSNAKLRRVFGIELPDWRTQLHTVFDKVGTDAAENGSL
jgi:dTDP-4-dehydrorhamnose reductase